MTQVNHMLHSSSYGRCFHGPNYATGNRQKVKETVGQSFFLSALIGIPFTLYLLSKPGE